MADSLLCFQILLFFIFIAFCVITPPTQSIQYSSASNGMVLDLIHGETIHPITYPPGSTLLDRVDLALSRALITKKGHHKYVINANLSSVIEPSGYIHPGFNTFYVTFFMGSMMVPQIASLDTGSDFLWIQCYGYENGQVTANPVYDPADSRSYVPSTCLPSGDYYCSHLREGEGGECDSQNRCTYDVEFLDGSYTKGFIGFENITFLSVDRQIFYMITNVLFGCGMNNSNSNKLEDGVFGIGSIFSLSIIKTTGYRFSFCFGGINEASIPSHLALGQEANLLGIPVPLMPPEESSYIVTLRGIVFGEFDRIPMSSPLEIIVDTGSTLSFISNDIYTIIRSKVDRIIGDRMEKIQTTSLPNGLCYRAEELTIPDFPPVTLELGSYTALVLDIRGMFWKLSSQHAFCLAFVPTEDDHNILGSISMQYHNVGFDFTEGRRQAYFLRVEDCRRLF